MGGPLNSYNLTLFLQKAAAHGLFVLLRPGPYVCAEWNYGGLPVWLNTLTNLTTRSSSGPEWEDLSQAYLTTMMDGVSAFFPARGGNLVIAQIENELHTDDAAYVAWCGEVIEPWADDVQWIMCNGDSAPDTINSCNSNDCVSFLQTGGQSG
jgi:beta-galactosidase GanA